MALRFAGLGSAVERPATKTATAQASLSAARRGARSDVAHIAPEVAAAYTLRMTRTRVVFRCDQNIMRAMRRGRAGARGGASGDISALGAGCRSPYCAPGRGTRVGGR